MNMEYEGTNARNFGEDPLTEACKGTKDRKTGRRTKDTTKMSGLQDQENDVTNNQLKKARGIHYWEGNLL